MHQRENTQHEAGEHKMAVNSEFIARASLLELKVILLV